MTDTPSPALAALHAAHDRLLALELDDTALATPSRADGWTVAQVCSHLGSGAEICTELLRRGIAGDTTGPHRDWVAPVWDRWNALTPREQVQGWAVADQAHLDLLDGLDEVQLEQVLIPYFIGPLSVADYLGYRLSEAVVHAWDVEAAFDPVATLHPDGVPVLLDRVDLVASRFADAGAVRELAGVQVEIELADGRSFTLALADELHLHPGAAAEPAGTLRTTAEALLRLVYGRHPEPLDVAGPISAAELRRVFPGF